MNIMMRSHLNLGPTPRSTSGTLAAFTNREEHASHSVSMIVTRREHPIVGVYTYFCSYIVCVSHSGARHGQKANPLWGLT